MRAIQIETTPLTLTDVPAPDVIPYLVRVRVEAISLNRGEVQTALGESEQGFIPGNDFAGIVEAAAADSGFKVGDRVAGLVPAGAWAEIINVPAFMLNAVPDNVSLEAAATLPVAGLTARLALKRGGPLKGKTVLVTGATGGVGTLTIQLAALDGAEVTVLIRDESAATMLRQLGARNVLTGPGSAGRYDLVIDNVGGEVLGHVLTWLTSGGTCVLVGNAGGSVTTFDASLFRMGTGGGYGGTSLYGFYLGHELQTNLPAPLLGRMLTQVSEGSLTPVIGASADGSDVDEVARGLMSRTFSGKAVLRLKPAV